MRQSTRILLLLTSRIILLLLLLISHTAPANILPNNLLMTHTSRTQPRQCQIHTHLGNRQGSFLQCLRNHGPHNLTAKTLSLALYHPHTRPHSLLLRNHNLRTVFLFLFKLPSHLLFLVRLSLDQGHQTPTTPLSHHRRCIERLLRVPYATRATSKALFPTSRIPLP